MTTDCIIDEYALDLKWERKYENIKIIPTCLLTNMRLCLSL